MVLLMLVFSSLVFWSFFLSVSVVHSCSPFVCTSLLHGCANKVYYNTLLTDCDNQFFNNITDSSLQILQEYIPHRTTVNYTLRARSHNKALLSKASELNKCNFLVHGQVCLLVCPFVCLCRVFLSRLWSDFDQTWTYVICLGLVVSPRI